MKLKETTFNRLKIGDKCLFMDDKKEIVYCEKKGKEDIVIPIRLTNLSNVRKTGQSYKCWKIIID